MPFYLSVADYFTYVVLHFLIQNNFSALPCLWIKNAWPVYYNIPYSHFNHFAWSIVFLKCLLDPKKVTFRLEQYLDNLAPGNCVLRMALKIFKSIKWLLKLLLIQPWIFHYSPESNKCIENVTSMLLYVTK